LNNIISKNSDGVYEGISIGGDKYPMSTFIDHIERFENDKNVKMIVLLGEGIINYLYKVGGIDEYEIANALKNKKITKPLIAWCIGTCSKVFPYEVQFGHAGALANGNLETSDAKNLALKESGALVPNSFEDFDKLINQTFEKLVDEGVIIKRYIININIKKRYFTILILI
jgi:ATP citrate (pro-S)-lyase